MTDPATHLGPSRHDPIAATARIVPPHLYGVLWRLALDGPLTAQEIADIHNRTKAAQPSEYWTSQTTAARLRGPRKLGLIDRTDTGLYLLTSYGREWMATGAAS